MSQNIYVLIEHLQGRVSDISYVMLAAGHQFTEQSGGKLFALLLGKNAQVLAADLAADQVFYFDHPDLDEFNPDAYLQILTEYIQKISSGVVLLGHTSIGMDLASILAVQLDLPLVSQCTRIFTRDDKPMFRSRICGGKIEAEGRLGELIALVTLVPGEYPPDAGHSEVPQTALSMDSPTLKELRIHLKNYIEPLVGDVDITKESVLIAVGRGLQNQPDMEIVEELAETLGGTVCGSRPIIDLGWLSTSRLVGKSGSSVKPKIYLALGISGAPEHVEGITGSDVIIAVNTDINAPIFKIAKYGINEDMIDVIHALLEQIHHAEAV